MRAGDRFAAGAGIATLLPTLDFETYSGAGYRWVDGRLHSLEGIRETERGLSVVGARNHVLHPTFAITLLSWDLFDGAGLQTWRPGMSVAWDMPGNEPCAPLVWHVFRGGLLEAWNAPFEWAVWNLFCVPRWGWPPLPITQMRCAMAKARAHAWPGKLENAGPVVLGLEQKRAPVLPDGSPMPGEDFDDFDDDIPF